MTSTSANNTQHHDWHNAQRTFRTSDTAPCTQIITISPSAAAWRLAKPELTMAARGCELVRQQGRVSTHPSDLRNYSTCHHKIRWCRSPMTTHSERRGNRGSKSNLPTNLGEASECHQHNLGNGDFPFEYSYIIFFFVTVSVLMNIKI